MEKIIREISMDDACLHMRECGMDDDKENRTIEGRAIVFGVRSVNLTPWHPTREVYEVMEPGCINQELIDKSDVMLTAFHNNELIMGRSTNGHGTLKLMLDERGVTIACDLPHTNTADDMIELIKRGDISGMSFAFTTDDDDDSYCVSYEKTGERSVTGKEVWLRHVRSVNGLYDVTIAGRPAYQQTDVYSRSIENAIDAIERRGEDHATNKENEEADRAAKKAEEERRQQERLRAIAILQAEIDYMKGY